MADHALTTTTIKLASVIASVSDTPAVMRDTNTGWSSPDGILTKLFAGDPLTIVFAFIVTISLPVLLHLYFYAQTAKGVRPDGVPTFLVVGSVGAGKTSFVTQLQKHSQAATVDGEKEINECSADTQHSQSARTISLRLPASVALGSNKYRSSNDTELTTKTSTPYRVIDTPGHGKLRVEAFDQIRKPLVGVIFLVDSAAESNDTVQYLHDVLLQLQRRPKNVKKVKAEDVRVLLACNKQDLFTALPPAALKDRLQTALNEVRNSRRKGISAVDKDIDEEEEDLAGGGEEKFSFKLLEEEFGVTVDVLGGTAKEDSISKWEGWIGSCL